MTEDAWRSSATTDVLFPDDLEGYGPLSVVGEPIDAAETETDTVTYGVVAELDGHHDEDYLVAPKQLRGLIADAWRPDDDRAVFEILSVEKEDEHRDDAPWLIDGRVIENGDPL